MIAKYRKAEFPGEWWLTDFTMVQVERQLDQLRAHNAELEEEVARLRKALESAAKDIPYYGMYHKTKAAIVAALEASDG